MGKDVKDEIIQEFCKTAALLGAKSGLLAILASCGDTIDYETTLEHLRQWNRASEPPQSWHDEDHTGLT